MVTLCPFEGKHLLCAKSLISEFFLDLLTEICGSMLPQKALALNLYLLPFRLGFFGHFIPIFRLFVVKVFQDFLFRLF